MLVVRLVSLLACSHSLIPWDTWQVPDTDGCLPAVKAVSSLLKWSNLKRASSCAQPFTLEPAGCPCLDKCTPLASTRAHLAQETWGVQAGLLRFH